MMLTIRFLLVSFITWVDGYDANFATIDMLDAMQQLMTGDAEYFDQAFLNELRACWDETHPDLASAQDSAWQVISGK